MYTYYYDGNAVTTRCFYVLFQTTTNYDHLAAASPFSLFFSIMCATKRFWFFTCASAHYTGKNLFCSTNLGIEEVDSKKVVIMYWAGVQARCTGTGTGTSVYNHGSLFADSETEIIPTFSSFYSFCLKPTSPLL